MRAPLHLDPEYQAAVDVAEQRFRLLFSNPVEFEEVIRKGFKFWTPTAGNEESKINLMKNGLYSEEIFTAMMCGGDSFKAAPVTWLWDKLKERRIFYKALGGGTGYFADHHLDAPVLFRHIQCETFRNLFFQPSFIVHRYCNAVVAIDVEKDGQRFRGSGFVVQSHEKAKKLLVTCRHNIDDGDNIKLISMNTAANVNIVAGDFQKSPDYDLAVAEIHSSLDGPFFRLFNSFQIFDPVYTLGFPNVPCANANLLGHRGELNGVANLYMQKHQALIVSNYVTPGSSGCPVLRDDGLCIGMTIKWLEGEWDGESARFSAALLADDIGAFIDSGAGNQ